MRRRITDRSPSDWVPGACVWFLEALVMAALLVLLGAALSSGHAQPVPGITAFVTEHDPLRGTLRYVVPATRIRFAGGLPGQCSVLTPAGAGRQITGDLGYLHYYGTASGWRLDVTFRTWVPGRVFAAGFET